MTADLLDVSQSDIAEADQKGKTIKSEDVFKGDTTVVSISHPPFVKMSWSADEVMDQLEPPKTIIRDWNRQIPEKEIDDVWKDINYEERYREYLLTDSKADSAMFKLEMMLEGGDVVLGCTCRMYEYCPRRIVYEVLEERLEE